MSVECLWERPLPGEGRGCAVLRDSVVFSTDGSVTAFGFTGVKSWSVSIDPSLPRVVASGDVLAVPTASGLALLSSLGAQIAKVPLEESITSLEGGIAIAVTTQDRVLAVTRSGRVSWEQGGVERPVGASASDEGVLVARADGLMCFGETGSVLWKRDLGAPAKGISGGSRPLVWSDHSVTALGHRGSTAWERKMDGEVLSVRNDEVVAVLTTEAIHILSRDGEELQQIPGAFGEVAVLGTVMAAVSGHAGILFEDLEGKEVYFEVMCRDPGKCGTFVSAVPTDSCPKCGGKKALVRVVRTEATGP